MTLIKDLIDIPEQIQKGDFVLKLAEGVTRPELTLKDYVVTPELEKHFDDALRFIQSALQSNSSKASYLHGSFGSGKSHFMAVLNLILQGVTEARAIPELAAVITKHNEWIRGKKFLLVPYHMIGSNTMESGILGGYVDYIRQNHSEAPIPGVYLAEGLFQDAKNMRDRLGDDQFFSELSKGEGTDSGWGDLADNWDADRFDAAVTAPPGDDERSQLISALLKQFFSSYNVQTESQGEAFLSLDKGLAVISRHAQKLGYDGLILFLDELILWLAGRASDLQFVHQEGQKLAKLVEAQTADRPIPIISFVARQRDLSELIGDSVPGAEKLNFGDALKHWEGRFHRITLEDRNLPSIAEKRVLKCKSDAARKELNATFQKTAKVRETVMSTLLTSEGDRSMFQKIYPFTPALVQTLIAVSSVLQRERTALKVMMQLLVDQRDTLDVGSVVPVGDLFDVIAHGDEAFSPEMAVHFDNAKRLYHRKLLPMLEKQHDVRVEEVEKLSFTDSKRTRFRNDERLIKTLLLSALVPQVESLRAITPEKLAALNHGTISTPIPNREGAEVLRRCKTWAANVGELRISSDNTPTLSIQLSGVDTDSIIQQAQIQDNRGNRIRLVREMLFEQLGIASSDTIETTYSFQWRNTKRSCTVLHKNIREDTTGTILRNDSDDWRLIIDYPFDEPDYYPSDDRRRCDEFEENNPNGTKTLCWIPAFFSQDALKDVGTLVILEYILTGDDRFAQYSTQLSPQDRQTAKSLLENRRSVLRQRVQNHLDAAYGIQPESSPSSLDNNVNNFELTDQFVSLENGLDLRPPVAATLNQALDALLDQALSYEFPAAPQFAAEVQRPTNLKNVHNLVIEAAQSQDGRLLVPDKQRSLLRQIANPLKLGEMGHDATHFVIGQHWKQHFQRKQAEVGGTMTVEKLRQWIDQPQAMGLPKEVQNLVILMYAEQTGRSFSRMGLIIEPTLKDISNDCELKEQALPSKEKWEQAVALTGTIFNISVSSLLKAGNVADLESQVSTHAKSLITPCQSYKQSLTQALDQLSLSTEGDRFQTASAALTLIEQLCSASADETANQIVDTLATATIATSATAMAECIKNAETWARALDKLQWELLEAIAQLTDDRQSEAQALREDLSTALKNDEHVTGLAPSIQAAQSKAIRLLSQQPPAPTPAPPAHPVTPPPAPVAPIQPPQSPVSKGKVTIEENTEVELNLKEAQALIKSLASKVKSNQTIRLSIGWIIEEGETE